MERQGSRDNGKCLEEILHMTQASLEDFLEVLPEDEDALVPAGSLRRMLAFLIADQEGQLSRIAQAVETCADVWVQVDDRGGMKAELITPAA